MKIKIMLFILTIGGLYTIHNFVRNKTPQDQTLPQPEQLDNGALLYSITELKEGQVLYPGDQIEAQKHQVVAGFLNGKLEYDVNLFEETTQEPPEEVTGGSSYTILTVKEGLTKITKTTIQYTLDWERGQEGKRKLQNKKVTLELKPSR